MAGGTPPRRGAVAPRERYTGTIPSQSTSLLLFYAKIPCIAEETTLTTAMWDESHPLSFWYVSEFHGFIYQQPIDE